MNIENATLLKRYKFDFIYNAVAHEEDDGTNHYAVRMDKIIAMPPEGYYISASEPLFEDEPYKALNLLEEYFETLKLGHEKASYNQIVANFIAHEHENLFQWRSVYYGDTDPVNN